MRKLLQVLAVVFVLALMLGATGCPKNENGTPKVTDAQIRTGARVTRAAAQGFKQELQADMQSGDLKQEAYDALAPIVGEVFTNADGVANDSRNFDNLSSYDRRKLIVEYAGALNNSLIRLNAAGALHIKSEKARAHFNTATRGIRQGLTVANIVIEALPPEPQPSPTPSPTSAQLL